MPPKQRFDVSTSSSSHGFQLGYCLASADDGEPLAPMLHSVEHVREASGGVRRSHLCHAIRLSYSGPNPPAGRPDHLLLWVPELWRNRSGTLAARVTATVSWAGVALRREFRMLNARLASKQLGRRHKRVMRPGDWRQRPSDCGRQFEPSIGVAAMACPIPATDASS